MDIHTYNTRINISLLCSHPVTGHVCVQEDTRIGAVALFEGGREREERRRRRENVRNEGERMTRVTEGEGEGPTERIQFHGRLCNQSAGLLPVHASVLRRWRDYSLRGSVLRRSLLRQLNALAISFILSRRFFFLRESVQKLIYVEWKIIRRIVEGLFFDRWKIFLETRDIIFNLIWVNLEKIEEKILFSRFWKIIYQEGFIWLGWDWYNYIGFIIYNLITPFLSISSNYYLLYTFERLINWLWLI